MTNLNKHEEIAIGLANEQLDWIVGGLENVLQDYPIDSEEYEDAKSELSNHETLVNTIYDEVMEEAKKDFNEQHIKFATTEFIKNYISNKLISWGY